MTGPAAGRPAADALAPLAGTGELTKLAIRRDRVFLPAWLYVLVIIAVSGGYGVRVVYRTAASRARLAATVRADPALSFLYGQLHGSSLGAIASWRYLSYAALTAGLMSVFLVVRHTRADEESGMLDLVRATAVGRHATLMVAMLLALLVNLLAAGLTTAVLTVSGLPAAGAAAFGLAEAGCGLVAAAFAVIAAQISGTARGARGLAIVALAVAFLLRAIGDADVRHGGQWVTSLTPIGWAELTRPFAGDRWWMLAVPLTATAAGMGAGAVLAAHRDAGAGLMQPRPGRATASRWLRTPTGLAWRLERAGLAGWAAGFLAGGLAIGVLAKNIGQVVGKTGGVDTAFMRIAGEHALTNAYLAACTSLVGLVAAGYGVAAVLRVRAEETAQRADPVLATATGRLRWAGSHLWVAAIGTAVVLLAGGAGMGLTYGVSVSAPGSQVARMIGAALAQWPAAFCVAAVGVAAVGIIPRWSVAAAWAALGICGLIGVVGPALNLSQAVLDISPFAHVPRLPGGAFSTIPLTWLTVIAAALITAGLAGLRKRDIG